MRRQLIKGLVGMISLPILGMAQGRQTKPVTNASLAKSLLTLAEKAAINGLPKEARIILNAAKQVMES